MHPQSGHHRTSLNKKDKSEKEQAISWRGISIAMMLRTEVAPEEPQRTTRVGVGQWKNKVNKQNSIHATIPYGDAGIQNPCMLSGVV